MGNKTLDEKYKKCIVKKMKYFNNLFKAEGNEVFELYNQWTK